MTNTAYQTSGPAYNTPAAPSSDLQSASSMSMGWLVGAILGAIGAGISTILTIVAMVAVNAIKNNPEYNTTGADVPMWQLWLGILMSLLALAACIWVALQVNKLRKGFQAGQVPSTQMAMIATIIAIIAGLIGNWVFMGLAAVLMLVFMILTIMKANNAKKAPVAAAAGYAPAVANPTSYSNTTTTDYGNTQQTTTTTTTTDYNQAPRP